MLIRLIIFLFFLKRTAYSTANNFTFNGFSGANLTLQGVATVTSNGLLTLTNKTSNRFGHAFYPTAIRFKSQSNRTLSFATTFVLALSHEVPLQDGSSIAFIFSKTTNFSSAISSQYSGLFNETSNENANNHVFAVNISGNHVSIDFNSLHSINLSLADGDAVQVWIDFNGQDSLINVTISPLYTNKPKEPLLSTILDLSAVMEDHMYVGISLKNGGYVLGWSFAANGSNAPFLDYAMLPSIPVTGTDTIDGSRVTNYSCVVLVLIVCVIFARRRRKYAELFEDWEREYGTHRFCYKDLYRATKGFKEVELLGCGGSGRVYKGVLPGSKLEVAVKKIPHESRQGMKQFVAEVVSLGQLHHRNLVRLLGYCRRKGELLLVYDFMTNGSLDKFLYDRSKPTLNWHQRYKIVRAVASSVLYLHEEWEKVVVHRDIKASNVLLDGEMNGKLGDFGLARLYDHGSDPQTTHVVGTMGYLAPELVKMGRATTATDVFAFGAFLLEVACGRRPVDFSMDVEEHVLVNWVLKCWQRGAILEATDSRLEGDYDAFELGLVLKLGLLCLNPTASDRPSMRQVVKCIEGDVMMLPDFLQSFLSVGVLSPLVSEGLGTSAKNSFSSLSSSSGVDSNMSCIEMVCSVVSLEGGGESYVEKTVI